MNILSGISAVLAAIVGFFTWTLSLTALSSGVGPYLGGASFWGVLFFLAPLPLGIRLLSSSSPLSGVWWIVLTPIISAISLFVVAMSFHGTDYGEVALLPIGLLWSFMAFSKHLWAADAQMSSTSGNSPASSPSNRAERHPETFNAEVIELKHTESTQTELIPTLEAVDIRRIAAAASMQRVSSAMAEPNTVSRFFNAIRYGQIETVKQALSRDPVLILAKDVYGNNPIDVARQEGNTELLLFFKACSPQP